jgi:hypothetical protein
MEQTVCVIIRKNTFGFSNRGIPYTSNFDLMKLTLRGEGHGLPQNIGSLLTHSVVQPQKDEPLFRTAIYDSYGAFEAAPYYNRNRHGRVANSVRILLSGHVYGSREHPFEGPFVAVVDPEIKNELLTALRRMEYVDYIIVNNGLELLGKTKDKLESLKKETNAKLDRLVG